ncbi:uncharacterized protein LODBEIA_P58660 [Lodderomyces beijingensis]|uniref:Tag1-like fifth Ig-like domain-containing protein n=1 Tax=Lodderomyces beijingensis TaxID=1775926 RepID=A0ABP0ZWQ1_9ASCO
MSSGTNYESADPNSQHRENNATGDETSSAPTPLQNATTTDVAVLDLQQQPHEANENTPLLYSRSVVPHRSQFQRICRVSWLHLLAVLLLLFTAIVYLTARDIQEAVNQAIDVQVYNATLMGMTSRGVNVSIQGEVNLNYDAVDSNMVQRSVMKLGAALLGSLVLAPQKPVQVNVKLVDVKGSPFVHLANAHSPPIAVKIGNRATTMLDVESECTFEDGQFFEFLRYYYQIEGDVINLEVKALVEQVNVRAWGDVLGFVVPRVELHDFISIDRKDLKLPKNMEVKSFAVNSVEPSLVGVDVGIAISNDFALEMELGTVWWDVMFVDCVGNLVNVGNWKSLPMSIRPNEFVNLNVTGAITEMPACLIEDCADQVSPINQLVQHYLNGDPIQFYLHVSETGNNNNGGKGIKPDWLFDILKKIPPVRFEITLPRSKAVYPDEIVVGSTEIMVRKPVDHAGGKDSVAVDLRNNCTVKVEVPINTDEVLMELERLKMNFSLVWGDELILEARSQDFVYSSMTQSGRILDINVNLTDLSVDVDNPRLLGKIANKMLNQAGNIMDEAGLYINASLGDIRLRLPILNQVTLSHLEVSQVELPQKFNIHDNPLLLKQGDKEQEEEEDVPFMDLLDIQVGQIYFAQTTEHEAEFLVELSMFNPTNITFELPASSTPQLIELGVAKRDVRIGSVSVVDEVLILKQERNSLIVSLKLEYGSYSDKVILQDFISSYISSPVQSRNLTVDIWGNSAMGLPGINAFLQEIELRDVRVPNVTFDFPDLRITDINQLIIGVTTHILTSEIELEVYNPVVNSEIHLELFQSFAKHNEVVLGYLAKREYIIVPPGYYKTHRIPFKVNNDAASDILRNALNRDLQIDVMADLNLIVGQFNLRLMYRGVQLISKIRL